MKSRNLSVWRNIKNIPELSDNPLVSSFIACAQKVRVLYHFMLNLRWFSFA